MFDRLFFILGEAFVAMRRNQTMTFAAITTSAVSLVLIGGMALLYFQTVAYVKTIPGKFEMRVFLKEGTKYDEITGTAAKIRTLPGVGVVSWIPRDKAWAKMREENPKLTEGIENPLQDSFKVTLTDLDLSDALAGQIQKLPTVDPELGVRYLKDEQRMVDEAMRVFNWVGGAVGGLLFLAAGVLIFNATRLTVISRRIEVRIMQLVGAGWATIHVPFLIEGIVQGALGGFVATCLLAGCHRQLSGFWSSLSSLGHLPAFPFGQVAQWLCLTGAVYGMACSLLAVIRAPLRFR